MPSLAYVVLVQVTMANGIPKRFSRELSMNNIPKVLHHVRMHALAELWTRSLTLIGGSNVHTVIRVN